MKTKWFAVLAITLGLFLVVGLAGVGGWLLRDSISLARTALPFQSILDGWRWGPAMTQAPLSGPDYSHSETSLHCSDYIEPASGSVEDLTIERAQALVEQYLQRPGYDELEVHELMEFSRNFYAIVGEEARGIGAMELLVDKETGAVGPEQGPNMMWNTKYGMHRGGGWMIGGGESGVKSVSDEEAVRIAQRWLDEYRPGTVVEDHADPFYGYYTIHTLRDNEISGMLSVHGSTGQVWYHNWHGEFVQMIDHQEDEP
jgi:hypothetical protein